MRTLAKVIRSAFCAATLCVALSMVASRSATADPQVAVADSQCDARGHCDMCRFEGKEKAVEYWSADRPGSMVYDDNYRFVCTGMRYPVRFFVQVEGLLVCPAPKGTATKGNYVYGKIVTTTHQYSERGTFDFRLYRGDCKRVSFIYPPAEGPGSVAPSWYTRVMTEQSNGDKADAAKGFAEFGIGIEKCAYIIQPGEEVETNCLLKGGNVSIWTEQTQ